MKKPPLLLIFGTLCLAGLILSVFFFFLSGAEAAVSAALGALILIVPQQIFALKAFRYMGAQSTPKIVQGFYSGLSTKLILVAIGFALVFSLYKQADVFALMASFIVLVIINGLAPLLLAK